MKNCDAYLDGKLSKSAKALKAVWGPGCAGGGKMPFPAVKWGPGGGKKRLRIIKNGFHNPAAAEIFNSVTILRRF
jgi:hypothetical protein